MLRTSVLVGTLTLAMSTAAASDPITVACSGTQVVTQATLKSDPNSASGSSWDKSYTPTGFNFTLRIDADAKTVQLNGAPTHVRRFEGDQVVFNRSKSRVLAFALSEPDYTLDRQTGIIRFNGGSGTCKRVDTAPLF